MTSRDVVNVVQRRLKKIKVGHAGTLDPLAEGVLVLGVGPAVRLTSYVQDQPKRYRARFRLGESTVSGDLEGEITEHPELPIPNRERIDQAAAGLVGWIEQTPPAHSAIHVDGKRAYKRIRAGEQFEMPKRSVRVDSIDVLHYQYPDLDVDVVCGGGTYIRTLGIDLAKAAGSIALMAFLRRTGVGPFVIDDAVGIDQLREDDLESMLLPASMGVQRLPVIIVDDVGAERLGHGLCVDGDAQPPSSTAPNPSDWAKGTEAAAMTSEGELRAIVRRKNDRWCPHRVFAIDP